MPFVDPLTTMLDPTLPLTVIECDEWGDPLSDPTSTPTMKSYAPYENIGRRRYPAILATTSLNDTRVSYTEPAKWVARLRETVVASPRPAGAAAHRDGRRSRWQEREVRRLA